MMRFIVFLVFILACKGKTGTAKNANKYTMSFQAADSISISFNYQDSTDVQRISSVHKKDPSILKAFGEIFNKKGKDCVSKTVGFIDVYTKDSVVLTVEIGQTFSTNKTALEFLKIREGEKFICYSLSDGLSGFLSEYRELMK